MASELNTTNMYSKFVLVQNKLQKIEIYFAAVVGNKRKIKRIELDK